VQIQTFPWRGPAPRSVRLRAIESGFGAQLKALGASLTDLAFWDYRNQIFLRELWHEIDWAIERHMSVVWHLGSDWYWLSSWLP